MRLIARILAPIFLVLGLIAPASVASADPAETTKAFTFTFGINTCNGNEVVEGEGTFHYVTKEQKNGVFAYSHIYGQGIGSLGNEYVFYSNGKFTFKESSSPILQFDFHERLMLVSKGSAADQVILVHVNQDGLVRFETDCTG